MYNFCNAKYFVDACEQHKEEGPCQGNYRRWFFDKESKTCDEFIYGGCKGNNNNFLSESACKQKCSEPGRKKGKEMFHFTIFIGKLLIARFGKKSMHFLNTFSSETY